MATEKRLIRADETVDAFTKWLTSTYDGRMPIDIVNEIHTVDAVEVVRCKDCKQLMLWCKPTDKVIGECFIRKMNSEDEQFCMVGADDYCSYGERRTDGR